MPVHQYDKTLAKQVTTKRKLSILQLPLELLIFIFVCLRDASLDSPNGLGWLAVTRTCKLWRDLAINYPHLWTDIYTSSPLDAVRTFLERSGRLELNVYLNGIDPRGDSDTVTTLLESHMERVYALKGMTREMGSRSIRTLLLGLTERCKTVVLEYMRIPDGAMVLDLEGLNPRVQLKTLSLHAIELNWSCSIFHGLTELSIIMDKLGFISRPNIHQIQSILEHCPNLRDLVLDGVWPVVESNDETREPSLPHLERIVLDHLPFLCFTKFFKIFGVRDTVKIDASFDYHLIISPHPIPEEVLHGRERCNTLCIDVGHEKISLRSNPFWNDTGMSSDTAISINLCYDSTPASLRMMRAIRFLIQDPFWKTADEILVSFHGFKPRKEKSCMDNASWSVLLDGLSRDTKVLNIEMPFKKYESRNSPGVRTMKKSGYTVSNGLPEALSEVIGESGVRLPKLEKFTIIYGDLSDEDAKECYKLILKLIEKRTVHTNRACSVDFKRNIETVGAAPLLFTLNRIHN